MLLPTVVLFRSTALESIGEGSFEGCKNLESVNLGNEPTLFVASFSDYENPETENYGSKLMLIGANAFANCTSLAQINIPDSVKNISEKAFYGDTALANVEMSDNVIYISDECFNGCSALSTFIWNPESKHIGRFAFANCAALSEFDFVNVEKLCDNSFLNSGVSTVQLGEAKDEAVSELKEIETQSFMNCDNLATVGIGGNVSTIKSQAFASCENLETAVISDSVTEIADDAFEGCDKLTIYCTSGSYVETYALDNNLKVSTLVIAPIPNQTYTGKEIKPSISVSYSDESLEKTDYTVTYSNNINIGTAKVSVTGTGIFKYLTSKAGFEIVARKISDAVISEISDREYTGNAITPEINVVYNGITLKKGTDYTVSYSDNTEAGTATVTVKGIGNFKGDAKASFEIIKTDGPSSDNPPVNEPPADNDKSTFDIIIEFLTNSISTIINMLNFIFGLFGFSIG